MIPFYRCKIFCLFIATLLISLPQCLAMDNVASTGIEIELVKEFDEARLKAISPDGRKMLLEGPRERKSLLQQIEGFFVGRGYPPQHLIEIGTWETAKTYKVDDVQDAHFFADNQNLVFSTGIFNKTFINLNTNEFTTVANNDPRSPYVDESYYPLRDGVLLVRNREKDSKTKNLILVEFPSYREIIQVPYVTHPRNPNPPPNELGMRLTTEYDFIISNDRSILVYSYENVLVCRRTEDLEVLWTKVYEPYLKAYDLTISPNGHYVVAEISDNSWEDMRQINYISIYDGGTGIEISRFPLNTDSGMAISPDGRLLAVSESEYIKALKRLYLITHIYEVPSGKGLISFQHIQMENIKNPSGWSFFNINFTPDGQHIVTSSKDTRVWRITKPVGTSQSSVISKEFSFGVPPKLIKSESSKNDFYIQVRQKIPSFSVKTIGGQMIHMDDLRGKVVLLNFFDTSCRPEEMSQLENELWQKYRNSDFMIIAITSEWSRENIDKFIQKHHLTFPIVWDRQGTVFDRLIKRWVPSIFIIGIDGKVLYLSFGIWDTVSIEYISTLIDDELGKKIKD